jgi:hypothetical protein
MGEEILKQQCGVWRLEREIGQGAYGVVYLAVGSDGVRAAVKVCRREAVGDERYERELRGAKLYRAIPQQEGLVRMRELVETEWGFYTVMDLADDEFGGPLEAASGYRPKTLARVIEGEKALPLKECVKLGIALAGGLATLQRHHLLHRDIKPGNVIYIGGKPVLSDPGLLVDESDATSLVGTPGYVPPENFTAAAGDIYSLGLTLKAASFGRKLEDLDKGPAQEADTSAPLFPAWWRILNKATDPTPSRRYQSAKALIKDLKSLRMRMAIATTVWSRMGKIAVALSVLVLIGVSALSFIRQGVLKKEVMQQKEQIAPLKKFKTDTEEMIERSRQETLWGVYCTDFTEIAGIGSPLTRHKRNLATIEAVDKVKAAKFRSLLDKLEELDAKEDALRQSIVQLHKVAEEKKKKGIYITEEFYQAEKIYKEKVQFNKTKVKPLEDELKAMWEDFKAGRKGK